MSKLTEWPVTGYRVVVRQDPVANVSKGGILMDTPDRLRRRQAGQTVGTIVGIGSVAFTGPDYGPGDRDRYQIGTRVLYTRYGGQCFSEDPENPNSTMYHILADNSILMPFAEDDTRNLTQMT